MPWNADTFFRELKRDWRTLFLQLRQEPILVLMELENGVLVDVEMNVSVQFGYQVATEAVFEKGLARIGQPSGLQTWRDGRFSIEEHASFTTRFAAAYDAQIQRFVRSALEHEGWQVHPAATMAQGLVECGTRQPDLVILDLGLPDGDGIGLIRDLRTWSHVPLIVVSARSDERQKIAALDAGADDYLTKPFGIGELLARVRVATRRSAIASGQTSMTFGDLVVDLGARTVTKRAAIVHLTPTEFRLLALLATHAGKVLTHRHLLRDVWGPTHVESPHYLRTYMGTLRAKLEDDPAQPRHLQTVTAVGYRMSVPD